MLKWLRRKHEACRAGAMPEVDQNTDLKGLMRKDLLVVFKHSMSCPVSWAAHSQITRFRAKHPEVPIHILNVIKNRPVSLELAELSGVRHESPQIIVFRHGAVAAATSHGDITEGRLEELLDLAPVTEPTRQ
jgi:bacillithiol system protein YtxJ